VTQALQQLEIPVPEPNDYPASLKAFLHRKIWESTVGAVIEGLMQDDAGFFEGASRRLPVYCSDPVEWKSEFRTYVVRGRIVGTLHYWGDAAVRPDQEVIFRGVETLQNSGEATAAYGIDFGVLADGKTALMELNDGFGLGSYGLADDLYTELKLTRWEELMNQPQRP
jgi:hypothetical protein